MNSSRYRIVRINSDTRTSGTPTNFTIQFNDNDLQNVSYYTVKSATFPNLFPNVDGRNDTNQFTWFSTAQGGNFTVTVPVAQYTELELRNTLATLMTAAMAGLPGAPVITIDLVDGKFQFTSSIDTIQLLSVASGNLMGDITGITEDSVVGNQVSAAHPPALQGEQMVFIHSRQLNNSRAVLGNGRNVSSFCEVPITVPYGAIQTYVMMEDDSNVIFSGSINQASLNIRVRSPDGTLLELPPNQRLIVTLKAWY